MKKIIFSLGVYLCLSVVGCDMVTDNNKNENYKVTVMHMNVPQKNVNVMFILDNGNDSVILTDHHGEVIFNSANSVKTVIGMNLGFSGIKEISSNEKEVIVSLEKVEIPSYNPDWVGTFGVYSTDGNGDVKFRYQGTFINYYCTSYLPYLGETTNPNLWNGWPLTDFPAPWKGKKLLVPRRYQTYHRTVYGFSLSQALFLRSNI